MYKRQTLYRPYSQLLIWAMALKNIISSQTYMCLLPSVPGIDTISVICRFKGWKSLIVFFRYSWDLPGTWRYRETTRLGIDIPCSPRGGNEGLAHRTPSIRHTPAHVCIRYLPHDESYAAVALSSSHSRLWCLCLPTTVRILSTTIVLRLSATTTGTSD